MNKDAVIKLSERLQETTGISLLPLDREEIALKIRNLIQFPNYFAKTIFIPTAVLLTLTVLITTVFCFLGQYLLGTIFFVLGGTLASLCGLLFGVILFVNRLSKEIESIFTEVLKQVRMLLLEVGVADEDMIVGCMEIPALKEVIKATTFMVGISNIEKDIQKRLPYLYYPIFNLIEGLFESLLQRVETYLDYVNTSSEYNLMPKASGISSSIQNYSKTGISDIDRLIRERTQLVKKATYRINKVLKIIVFILASISFLLCSIFLGLAI